MPMLGDKGKIIGSQALAKGVERVAIEVDKYMGKTALRPHLRPSTYINVVGGLAAVFVPNYMRKTGTLPEVLEIMGGHMANQGWDYLEEYMAAAPAAAVSARTYTTRYTAAETPGGAPEFYPPLYGQAVSREPVIKNHVRYSLTK